MGIIPGEKILSRVNFKKKFNFEKLNSLCADSIKKINRFVNAQRVLQVILEEQLLVDGFTGKKSKEAAGYQKAIDFLKGRELEIREMSKAAKQKTDAD